MKKPPTAKVSSVTSAPGWSAAAGSVPAAAAPAPPSSYVGPTTSTPAASAAPRTYPSSYQVTPGYDMSIPGASEYAYGAVAPALQTPGYAEAYANLPAYQAAQQSTASNQLLSSYGAGVAQPTSFENWANTTAAPSGGLYGVIAANQGQVTGTSDLMNYARSAEPETGNIQRAMAQQGALVSGPSQLTNYAASGPGIGAAAGALGNSYAAVTDPTRIGQYMQDPSAYRRAGNEGEASATAASTQNLVDDNTLARYAADPNAQYRKATGNTAAEREMAAAGEAMASGVDRTTASGTYWDELQRDPTALPDANLDAYYDRQRQKAQQDIDKMMAARGLFGSSASSDASREMMLDLAGQQVKAESDYSLASALARNDIKRGAATGADEAGISRYVSRNDAARGVDAAALGLGRLGLDARSQNDENTLKRYIAQNDVAQGIDAGARDLYLGRGDLANRSDLTDATRFSAYNDAARGVDALTTDAYSAQAGAMADAGALDIGRYNASVNAGNMADQTGVDVYNSRANALNNAGQLDVSRFNANTGATGQADRTSLDRYVAQSDTLNNAANTGIDRYRALTEGATAADNASRSLYTAGADVARGADQSLTSRYGTLLDSAGQADLSRTGRTQIANDSQYNYTSMLDSILNSGYGDLIGSDEELMSLITQLGLGSGATNLQGALNYQGGVGAQGAQIQQIGAQADAANRQILTGLARG